MEFKVRDWMINVIVYIDPDASVADALSIMRRRYIHSIIVNSTKGNPEYGIVTSTDISDKIFAQDRNPSKTKISELMSSPLITVKEDMLLTDCAVLMREKHIHHLPVVNSDNQLVGMISATDFLVAAEAMCHF